VEKRLYTREEIGFNGQAVGQRYIHTGPGGNLIDHDGPLAYPKRAMVLKKSETAVEKSDALPYGNNRCGSRNKFIFSILCPSSQRL
jgi:hypothetical protein